ncbi:LPXTG cell wall anchor domain-containing protein [Streptomyces sp. MBT56]|uniref:LPXTG cell wall anchor domain-containing protein n=2 Tax=unclassified Streptomyces TaxID=2593676 RepID=UPI00190C3F23|nr:LPXTG cell wall anchor domain-containing protein [Streptomyces sp. MBT56]MBK3559621.1 LPXTG cell wall anchor domain-containing protein [Streptomyces sp. MBT56]
MAAIADISIASPLIWAAPPVTAAEVSPSALTTHEALAEGRRPAPATSGQETPVNGTAEGNVVPVETPQSPPTSAPSGLAAAATTAEPASHRPEPEQSAVPAARPEALGTGHGSATTDSAAPAISSESTEEEEAEEEQVCFDHPDRDAVRTTLHDLPGEIVAGSGWHNFTFRVTNTSDRPMKSVTANVLKAVFAPSEDFKNLEHLLTLEWYDQETGTWEVAEPGYGHSFDLPGLLPGEHIDIKLRIKVHARPVSGLGQIIVEAEYRDENDLCGYTGGDDGTGSTAYEFAIIDENSEPPAPSPSPAQSEEPAAPSPSPTQQENRKDTGVEASTTGPTVRPPYETETPATPAASSGSLAQTGSSAATWLLGAGCISVALGSGIAVAARRRRNRV